MFTVEAIIKIIALGKNYFKIGWNIFDFIIVLATIIGLILDQAAGANIGSSTTAIRSFRIGRVFRLIKKFKELRTIFNTFIISIPSLANVGGLLFLFLYLYAILGMFLFSGIKLQDNLSDHANF